MVSFWPWKRDDSSTASFEKTLSTLSVKIADAQSRLDRLRASSRRVKVLWTLYLAFAYIVYAIVVLLVIGYASLGALEWTGLAGGPVLIYLARRLISAYYSFRIDSVSTRLKEYQAERAKTIQKLKDATRYDSTLELIEKYGGEGAAPKGQRGSKDGGGEDKDGGDGKQGRGMAGRTKLPPPPTANIQRPPLPGPPPSAGSASPPLLPPGAEALDPTAEFAPNAFAPQPFAPQPALAFAPPPESSHWYDRIFDVLLGDDEALPRNRFALICRSCRLVNGQAPPGTRSLAELGTWRCMACGVVNGEANAEPPVDEGAGIVGEVLGGAHDAPAATDSDGASDEDGGAAGGCDGPAGSKSAPRSRM